MRIKADFIVTPAAHQRLIELGHKHVSRMNGAEGWGISVDVPEGVLICTQAGSPEQASRWDVVRTKTLHAIWIGEKYNTVTGVMEGGHAECWVYETPGPKYGQKVCYLPGWTEEDCK